MSATPTPSHPVASSFRDPSGFVYLKDGIPYRQVNHSYQKNYDLLMQSGLYAKLIEEGLLVSHEELPPQNKEAYKVLKPEVISFISYPYEWPFSQLQDAALVTLRIQQLALDHGMSLKDASAYNIQFLQGRPVLIDTLSFEEYAEGRPWIAYRQFCQHFLAPLALMAHDDLHLGTLSQLYIDGVPLELASRLLPGKTRFSIGLGTHIHLHARSQSRHAEAPSTSASTSYNLGIERLRALLQNLESTTASLKLHRQKTVWDDYYETTHNYSSAALSQKEQLVEQWTTEVKPASVWDAGANDSTFSRLASSKGILTVASDIDPIAVERAYQQARQRKDASLLPLILDLTNPSPSIGWANQERDSFLERSSFDLTYCLALVHHLAIANNLPLPHIAALFAAHTEHLIIEFVPKQDSNAQKLLAAREDIFPDYETEGFERAFTEHFTIVKQETVKGTSRTLYLMKRKQVARK